MSKKKKLDDYKVGDVKMCVKEKAKAMDNLVKTYPYLAAGAASVLGLVLGAGLSCLCKRRKSC